MKDDLRELLGRSICQWCYGKDCSDFLPCCIKMGHNDIWYSEAARIQAARNDVAEIVILGECVDVRDGHDPDKLAETLCRLDDSMFEKEIEYLCGVYAIFRRNNGDVRVYGDAIHMMSVYYGVNKHAGIVASCEALIVDDTLQISNISTRVLSGAYDSGIYLAGDMTMYDDVKALLPNHYWTLKGAKAVRYFPREKLVPARTEAEVDEILDNMIKMVDCCIRQFAKRMSFASPLTPGGDSRLNCAFIDRLIPREDVMYYVINTKELQSFKENEALIKTLAKEFKFEDFHFYPEVETISEGRVGELKRIFGPIREWRNKIWSYHPAIGTRTLVSGDLIGHVLGGQIGKLMPEWLVGDWFLKVIQRNVSRIAGKEVERWYLDAKDAVHKAYSKIDLWYWEIRCGRWNANTISRDDLIGIRVVNFYNAHRIIKDWCRIPRQLRVRKLIHKRLLKRLNPSVADIAFNPCVHRGSRMSSPILARIIPVWCRTVVVHVMEMVRRRSAV